VKPVLLDTGPIVAMLDRSERRHKECADLATQLESPLITCEAVIAEACYLLRDLKGAAEAVLENVERGVFLVPYQIIGRAAKVARLMKKYADQPMDFADACLVDMAGELSTGQVLTLDADFRIYRWGRNRAFELLIEPRS
jgi:predicted nucleic acid-binding protein